MAKKVRRSTQDPDKPKFGARIYSYFNPQLNKYQDAPEDPNAFVDWEKYTPSAAYEGFEYVENRMTDKEQQDYTNKVNNAQVFGRQIEKEIERKDPEKKQYSVEELQRISKESIANYWDQQLKDQEAAKAAREKEKQRLMQEFVDQQNASKSPLQSSFGNLSLENPATRDAARNYAEYKLGESSPLWASDRLLTGHDEPTTRDFYRPHEATFSFGIPAAAATAVAASPAIGAGLVPAIGGGVSSFLAMPIVNPVTGAAIAEGTLTFGNALNAYFIAQGVKSLPETYKAWEKAFTEEGKVKEAAIQTLYNALDFVGAGEGKAGAKMIAEDVSKGYNYAKNFTKEGYNVAKKAVGKTLNTIDNNKYYQALTLQDKTGVMSKKVKAANDAMMDIYDTAVPVSTELAKTSAEVRQRNSVIRRKYNKYERYPFVDGLKTLENKARMQAIEKSQNFAIEGEALTTAEGSRFNAVTKTGQGTIVDFKTGKFITAKVEPIGKKLVYKKESIDPEILKMYPGKEEQLALKREGLDKQITSETVTSSGQAAPEYVETLKSNIQHVEETIPGAKIFGSSVGVTEGGLPHLTGDLDALITESAYKSNVKGAYKHLETKGPAEVHDFGIGGEGGHIDFNIIHENADGTVKVVWQDIGGGRQRSLELELFKQVDPDGFYKASEEAMRTGQEIKIPYKSQELLDKVDPAVKTIMDAYESTKTKHMNRIDSYINFGNPEVVAKAQQQYAKSLVGGKGTVGPQFSTEALSDVAKNKNILADIGFIGEVEVVAKSPERMQLALNDFYINNTIYTRQTGAANDLTKIKHSVETIKKSFQEWRPTGIGSGQSMNGWGLNTTQHADPQWKFDANDIIGNRQVGLKVSSESPTQMIADVKRQTDGNYIFTPDEKDVLLGIFKKVVSKAEAEQMATGVTKTMDLLKLPTGKTMKTQKIFNEVTKQLGIKSSTNNNVWQTGWYSSMLGDFDEAIDALAFTFNKTASPPKSYLQRERNLQTVVPTAPTIEDVKEFTLIENYVNGGVEKARARAAEYEDSLRKIAEDLKKLEYNYSKDLQDKVTELSRQRLILQKEADAAHQKYWDLVSRQQKLAKIRKESLTLIGGAATIGGIGTYIGTQPGAEESLENLRDQFGTGVVPEEEEEKYFEQKRTGGFNYTKNMLNANSTGGARSDQSWQDPGVNRFSGNTNGVKADYYLKKGGLKQKVSSKFKKLKN